MQELGSATYADIEYQMEILKDQVKFSEEQLVCMYIKYLILIRETFLLGIKL